MKVKASLVVNAVGILKSMDLTKMRLSTAYKVRMVITNLQSVVEDFEGRRLALAQKHGELDEDKTRYNFPGVKDQEAFQEGMQALLDDELDIKLKKIPIDLIDDYVEIEPANVELVSWFVSGLQA